MVGASGLLRAPALRPSGHGDKEHHHALIRSWRISRTVLACEDDTQIIMLKAFKTCFHPLALLQRENQI